ncbi:hypothetical protein Salat_1153500 [Sesamum alatum]|uniref:Uncharacterized protein n=1 Tax=Sesamum alatum TaxID=300844 RepID=A0AAE2CNC9_9LAMI|nr:hypothetical protein Salat_1153500 [Sesamum alatum]
MAWSTQSHAGARQFSYKQQQPTTQQGAIIVWVFNTPVGSSTLKAQSQAMARDGGTTGLEEDQRQLTTVGDVAAAQSFALREDCQKCKGTTNTQMGEDIFHL